MTAVGNGADVGTAVGRRVGMVVGRGVVGLDVTMRGVGVGSLVVEAPQPASPNSNPTTKKKQQIFCTEKPPFTPKKHSHKILS